jgi:hypothetical protein
MKKIKVENWKGKRVFTARDEKGRLISWRYYKNSGLNKKTASIIFKENKSFNRDKSIQKLSNVREITILKSSNINSRQTKKLITPRPDKQAQYIVQGYYMNKRIIARSQKVGSALSKTSQDAKEYAWNNFLLMLGQEATQNYDADEGIKEIDKVKGLKEGWVYYR